MYVRNYLNVGQLEKTQDLNAKHKRAKQYIALEASHAS
jgi:hypothetical protein